MLQSIRSVLNKQRAVFKSVNPRMLRDDQGIHVQLSAKVIKLT